MVEPPVLEPSPPPAPPAHTAAPPDWEQRMQMVDRLLRAFRLERYAYVTLSVLACGVLLYSSYRLFAMGQPGQAMTIFGSGGVLAFTLSRVLRMWQQAWNLVTGAKS